MRNAKTVERSEFFGLSLDVRTRPELCSDIRNALAKSPDRRSPTCFCQHSLNAIKLPGAVRNDALFGALARADCLSADGMGIVWAARMMGIKVPERVTGIELMTDLLGHFAHDRVRVFLLGARQEVLDRLSVELPLRFPGLIIAGTHHGYEMDDQKLVKCVAQAKADALFVALPSPRKEIFVDHFAPQTGCRFAMGVGGAFDVLAGEVKRAPIIWQRTGIEFLWRIACQPRYMIPRYAHGLSAFARMVLPTIAKMQCARIRSILRKLAVVGALMPIMWAAAEGQAQTITSDRFELTDQQSAISWLEANITELKDPNDLSQIIDQLVAGILSRTPETDAEATAIDWQVTEENLEIVLGLFDVVLANTGASRFLLETVLGGVVLGLTDMHPRPDQFQSLVAGFAPDLAGRLFGGTSNRPAELFDTPTSAESAVQSEKVGVVKPVSQPETEWDNLYSFLDVDPRRNQTGSIFWAAQDYQKLEGILELEDASPR
ncbi:WecB/TagA/CpsF family glycosyltransferase [Thalassospira australica]|uniref:WecB/TagA/CpsF family glycosyltransferase n=1 Tax=Thalassospira australica TaxID=1528106 RepID=UPI00068CB92D|nr:WecB/TagA/CpsF family glycosyltransferase [Thalassospira australica]